MPNTRILSLSKSIDILITLKKMGTLSLSQLITESSGSTAVVSHRISDLKAEGLIKDEREIKFGGKRLISLTEKGNNIAKHLLQIEKVLNK